MKHHTLSDAQWKQVKANFFKAIASIENTKEAEAFLTDLCTPSEIESMADRWSVVPRLQAGIPYRKIHEETGVSVTTIGRVARTLEMGTGGYRKLAERNKTS